MHDLFEDPVKIPSYSKALKLHFLGEKPDYEETIQLHKDELKKVKMITGSVRKANNHHDINVDIDAEKRVSVEKKVFNIGSSDAQSRSHSNESSPQRAKRMATIFDNLFDNKNEDIPDFNQKMIRKHTYYVKADKLLNEESEQKIQEGGKE